MRFSIEKKPEKKRCKTVAPEVDYSQLVPAISTRNSQLALILKFVNEKSGFKAEQVSLIFCQGFRTVFGV